MSRDPLVGPVTEVKVQRCLGCDGRIDQAAVVASTQRPKPGDFAICNRCGAVMAWTSRMTLRPLTLEEKQHATARPDVRSVAQAVRTRNDAG